MRRIVLASAIAACCLASTATAQGVVPPGAGGKDAGSRVRPSTKTFNGLEPSSVWKGVEIAYKQASVEPTFVNRSDYKMAYVVSPAPKKIAGVKLQDAFDCGGDKKSPNAGIIDLEVTLTSVVNAIPDGSEVVTTATAMPVGPLPTGEVPACFSKGRLERKFEPDIKTGGLAFTVITRQR